MLACVEHRMMAHSPWHRVEVQLCHCLLCSAGISGASYYEGFFANIARNDDGEYVAVSSRGNFYMTWQAGQVNTCLCCVGVWVCVGGGYKQVAGEWLT